MHKMCQKLWLGETTSYSKWWEKISKKILVTKIKFGDKLQVKDIFLLQNT